MNPLLLTSIIFAVLIAAVGATYSTGAFAPIIGVVAKYIFKAKAEAETKALEAQGKKEGDDFFKGELDGSQQAADVGAKFGI